MTQVVTALDVQPQSGWTGAEIHGVDLTKPLDQQQIAEIRAALLVWKVVFFRDQSIDHDDHLRFAWQVAAEHRRNQPAGDVRSAACRIADDHRNGLALERNRLRGCRCGSKAQSSKACKHPFHARVSTSAMIEVMIVERQHA